MILLVFRVVDWLSYTDYSFKFPSGKPSLDCVGRCLEYGLKFSESDKSEKDCPAAAISKSIRQWSVGERPEFDVNVNPLCVSRLPAASSTGLTGN